MAGGAAEHDGSGAVVLDQWVARKIQPIVLLYVTVVFAVFMAVSIFLFHSRDAVKALAIGWIGAIAATVPGVIERTEYRLTAAGLDTRPNRTNSSVPFKQLFRWDELDHIVPMKHGFKYYKTTNDATPLRRFWQRHVSGRHSGEVHADADDLHRVVRIIEQRKSHLRPRDEA